MFTFGNINQIKAGGNTLVTNIYAANNGKQTRLAYGNGAYENYFYDILERLNEIRYNGVSKFKWEFDNNGNISKHTDLENNRNYAYEYDNAGRLIRTIVDDNNNTVFAAESKYDEVSRLSEWVYKFGSEAAKKYTYQYSADSLINQVALPNNAGLNYVYDSLNRLTTTNLSHINNGSYNATTTYEYLSGSKLGLDNDSNLKATTSLLSKVSYQDGTNFSYTYDNLGNIITISESGVLKSKYTYDNLNQLVREDNAYANKTYVYIYDLAGNITSVVEFAYTTGNLSTPTKGTDYTYGDSSWKDKLTKYGDITISYDNIGNPLNWINNATLTWKNGRQLATYNKTGTAVSYKYNAGGIRTQKTVNDVITDYTLSGSNILREQKGTTTIDYLYDNNNAVIGMVYNGTSYYYQKNAQNDISRIVDCSGNVVVEYTYDAWGNVISTTGSLASTIGEVNPFRYRSYYYDTETGLFYVGSRYYDPEIGRFISPDLPEMMLLSDNIIGTNLYSYCYNNPVNYVDPNGYAGFSITQAAQLLVPAMILTMFMAALNANYASGLVAVGAYVTKIISLLVIKSFWWKPWLAGAIIVGAVAIVTTTVIMLYNAHVAKINNNNMNKKVRDILKTKKGSIKNAPLKPGGPSWNDILELTLAEIIRRAQQGDTGFDTIKKLLTDGRFNK